MAESRPLARDDAALLREFGVDVAVTVGRDLDGAVRLTASSTVGLVRVDDVELVVRPKVGVGRLSSVSARSTSSLRQPSCGGSVQDAALVLARGVVVRALVLGSWSAGMGWDDVLEDLFTPVADVPFTRCSRTPGGSAFCRARRRVPGEVVAAVCEAVLAVLRAELVDPADPQALRAGVFRVAGVDGSLFRLPDTEANRALFGAGSDPAPFPHVRLLLDVDAGTKTPLGYVHGPASGAKDASEQALLDELVAGAPALRHRDLLHVADRNYPGATRLARLADAGMNLAVRLRAGITVTVDEWLPDGSFLGDVGSDDILPGWRQAEWDVLADGAHTGETFAATTSLTNPRALPAPALAAGYRARWGATETPIREIKATLRGSGGAGPMLRATDPFEVDQEIPALILGTALLRAVQRTTAGQAAPARKGARAGQPVLVRELSYTATVRAVTRHLTAAAPGLPDEITASRLGALHAALGRRRETPRRGRSRERRSKSPSEFPHPARTSPPARTSSTRPGSVGSSHRRLPRTHQPHRPWTPKAIRLRGSSRSSATPRPTGRSHRPPDVRLPPEGPRDRPEPAAGSGCGRPASEICRPDRLLRRLTW
ncbi:transposase [Pseudofrankia sp. DC12]|uniref:transposase n=1 Tax=Pseudofrankia sp. DC12 TaxID=683315 RepID=UPI0005F76D15|nr:transposase [Pseudofrankia sp. DC12]